MWCDVMRSAVHLRYFSSKFPTFFSPFLLRQLKLKIAFLFSIFLFTFIRFLYSLLLLFSCFESIFILNTDTEKQIYTYWKWIRWMVKGERLTSATRSIEHLTLYRIFLFLQLLLVLFSVNHLKKERKSRKSWNIMKKHLSIQLQIFRFLFFLLIWCQLQIKRSNILAVDFHNFSIGEFALTTANCWYDSGARVCVRSTSGFVSC